jgi:glyoxylase-like metal-dependent hydrolase (beta-lactamase superfamily II)
VSAERLSDNVTRVLAPNPSPMTLEGTNTYVVGDSRNVIVIDPGPADAKHLGEVMRAVGDANVAGIFLTHWHGDHSEGAEKLSQTLDAPLGSYSPLGPEEIRIHDGDRAGAGTIFLTAIHTPGHASDHMCFWLEEERALFTGDHVLGRGTTVVAHPDGDMGAYMSSLQRIQQLDAARFYPGHGPVVDNPGALLDYYIAHRIEREQQVVDAMPGTPEQLVETIYAGVDKALHPVAAMSVRAHLAKLEAEGRAVHDAADRWSVNG